MCNNIYSYLIYTFIGPKPKTIEDFWAMITQEEISTIICLTNLKEGAKVILLMFNSKKEPCITVLHVYLKHYILKSSVI